MRILLLLLLLVLLLLLLLRLRRRLRRRRRRRRRRRLLFCSDAVGVDVGVQRLFPGSLSGPTGYSMTHYAAEGRGTIRAECLVGITAVGTVISAARPSRFWQSQSDSRVSAEIHWQWL